MLGKFCLAFVVAIIVETILSVEVDAQSTVDDSGSCESSSFDDEAVNLIRQDLKDVKNLLASNQQQNNESTISKKDLADLKAACASTLQQCRPTELSNSTQDFASSLSCNYITLVTCF